MLSKIHCQQLDERDSYETVVSKENKMSMKRSAKHVAKKRARQKEVKKALIEKRLRERKEKRLEHERELAFEREFAEKNKMGLTNQEVKDRLTNNMQILEALENEFIAEEQANNDPAKSEKALAQLQAIEEFGKIQGEIINLEQEKAALEKAGEFTEEKMKEHSEKLDALKNKITELQKVREENIL